MPNGCWKIDPNVYRSKLFIDVKVVGNRAITNMTMVFKNKSNRLLEGELVGNGSRTIATGYEEELSLNNKRSLRYHLSPEDLAFIEWDNN